MLKVLSRIKKECKEHIKDEEFLNWIIEYIDSEKSKEYNKRQYHRNKNNIGFMEMKKENTNRWKGKYPEKYKKGYKKQNDRRRK